VTASITGIFLGLVGLLLFLAVTVVFLYNRMLVLRNRVDNAWAQIDVQLKRRYDLIPNLVQTVKGYAAHEQSTFEQVVKARQAAMGASAVKEQGEAENMLSSTLKSLFAIAEAYPELKANENFMMLQEELAGTESKIAYARQFYNDSVLHYNNGIQMFPANLLAGIFAFTPRESFEVEESVKEAPQVRF